ncbi:MAG: ArsR family transcriptional regulator [Candidatus Thorarchaeota archaeon]|nr:ArsR family transcriptional regulator [Candidatus Thorarchaeota archaeon]
MPEDIDKIKEELKEIQRIRVDLQKELEDLRQEKKTLRSHERQSRSAKPVRPLRSPRARRTASIDLDPLMESLDVMMDDLGEQIRFSLSGIEDIGSEIGERFSKSLGKKIRISPRTARRRTKRDKEVEAISPERVARIVNPLGSEERLRILDFLREGGKTFNELENHTGKTGSSLTHHLNSLLEAGYVIKGEVRGTYYVTVEGRLAYRLAQWLTSQVERERSKSGENGESRIVRVVRDKEEDLPKSEVDIDDDTNGFGINVEELDFSDEEDEW